MLLPSFSPDDAAVPLPPDVAGVALRAAAVEGERASARWPLHGSFRVPLTAAREAEPESVLRELVIAVQQASTHDIEARYALSEELLFPEDVSVSERFISGSFHLDLLRLFAFSAEVDRYFITAYLPDCAPVTIVCAAELPWLAQPSHDEEDADDAEADIAGLEPDASDASDEPDDDDSWMVDEPG
jgi:hypothetical protein